MPATELDDDDGYLDFTVKVGTDVVPCRLDLFRANNKFAQLAQEFPDPDQAERLGDAWAAWLQSQGLPAVTHRTAFRVADLVTGRVAAEKKSETPSPTPDSAASTGSPPSD
jgi:hypothetical protein